MGIKDFLRKIGIDKEKEDKQKSEIEIPVEDVVDIEISKIELIDSSNNDINDIIEDNAYGISHKGNRTNNEDSILIKRIEDIYLLAVADGVGGHKAGDVASKMAIDILKEVIKEKYNQNLSIEGVRQLLKDAYESAHNKIKAEAVGDKEGMATTLTTAIIKGNLAIIANCGDSRAYLIRNNEIVERTRDHSLVQALIDEGHITEEEAIHHPMKNIITSALGIDDFKVDIYEWNLKEEGDILLLSSDGLHDYIKKEEILEVIKNKNNPKEIVKELLDIALKKTKDNVSIIVYSHKTY
ncbi:protein serine/threonine phosphatase [Methanocaldococcus vulcanius M7]|uniref:Protein serine/threonine phosphatase n=1 Tax=Methanocaldococcus vulcanius (strain ATCC 700851 / DSM 12094 / M7) TaxID=579137 RepID=C9RH06_METVM|nr:protein phosphatase 2C domain-containing protein [Methanocaldococcus vulcanius]ACX72858.1 protein serine/threonine phosphatase [Methanocaldococcus vulcanius M7]